MTVKDISEYLKIKEKAIYALVNRSLIPHSRIGKLIRFKLEEIDEWMKTPMADTKGKTILTGSATVCENSFKSIIEALKLKGTINTKQNCPTCKYKFNSSIVDNEGIYCPACNTRPTRYYINAKIFGIGHLYSEPNTHKVFNNYADTLEVLIAINQAWKNAEQKKTRFRKEDFIPAKVEGKRVENLLHTMITSFEYEVRHNVKSQTRLDNLNKHKVFIVDYFKGTDIREIETETIEKFYHGLLRKNLSTRYIKDILDTLKSIFIKYVGVAHIPTFPNFTVIPKLEKQRLGLAREIAIMDKVPDRHGYRIAILVLIRTGMRLNEVPALKVHDLDDGIVHVTKAFTEGKLKLARKNGGSVPYHVTPELWEMLMEHIKDKEPDDYVFTIDGRPIPTARLYKVWKKACSDAKVKTISLQQASRHSKASEIMADHKKRAMEEIQKQLGHNNAKTGIKHYVIED